VQVPEILKALRQEKERLQLEPTTLTAAIEELELVENGGRRRRGRPRRLPGIFELDTNNEEPLSGVVKKTA